MSTRMRTALGVIRSLRIYYLHRRRRRMEGFYRALLGPGDLAFDVGSHVGDRIARFRRIGARVLALEPQPALFRTLHRLYGRDPGVTLLARAVGRVPETRPLYLNLNNPTVSTLSSRFIAAARDAPGWTGQRWDTTAAVEVTRLDDLIAAYGMPRYIKIDVEGYEAEALAGLSRPVQALSFEVTSIQREIGQAALDECRRLGYRHFNAALGESFRFALDTWVGAPSIARWIRALDHRANSGDLYAVRSDHPILAEGFAAGPVR